MPEPWHLTWQEPTVHLGRLKSCIFQASGKGKRHFLISVRSFQQQHISAKRIQLGKVLNTMVANAAENKFHRCTKEEFIQDYCQCRRRETLQHQPVAKSLKLEIKHPRCMSCKPELRGSYCQGKHLGKQVRSCPLPRKGGCACYL